MAPRYLLVCVYVLYRTVLSYEHSCQSEYNCAEKYYSYAYQEDLGCVLKIAS